MLNISLSISDCEVMSICSNATHRLKRATDLRDCVSALCLQRERNMSLHACAQAHHMYMMASCSLSAFCLLFGRSCLSVWVRFITQSFTEQEHLELCQAAESVFMCLNVLPDCKASLLTAHNMTDIWSQQHNTANISSARWTFGSFKWMLQTMNQLLS